MGFREFLIMCFKKVMHFFITDSEDNFNQYRFPIAILGLI